MRFTAHTITLYLSVFCFGLLTSSCSKKTTAGMTNDMSQAQYDLNTRQGDVDKQMKIIRRKKKRQGNLTLAEQRNEFVQKRREERRRMLKQMENPQYSDPLFFGHKRPPKKRPVGKRKLCKECGIVH